MQPKTIEERFPMIDKWAGWASGFAWSKIGISDTAQIKKALGYRDVHAQFGQILGWLRDLNETELYREIEDAIDKYNAGQQGKRDQFT